MLTISRKSLAGLYKKMSAAEIARQYGVSAETVRKKLHELKIPLRPAGQSRSFSPPQKELDRLYQNLSMKEIANYYGVGETVVWKRIKEYGIVLKEVGKGGHRKKKGKQFSAAHRKAIGDSRRGRFHGKENPNWRGGKVQIICLNCDKEFYVTPARRKSAKFCSVECRAKWRSAHWKLEKHPRWQGGKRTKKCKFCGAEFGWRHTEAISVFRHRKFCSKSCADLGGFRYKGERHPNYSPDARRKNRGGKHASWSRAVISRDQATCQMCGARNVELHAHHIKPYQEYPELRWELSNGVTLCYRCHWAVHELDVSTPLKEKPVESVKKGRQTRRWSGDCDWCGKFISKRWSDAKGKQHHFCSHSCSSKFTQARRAEIKRKNSTAAR